MITEYSDICVICGKPKQETHHLVFGRGMRELADADGLTIPLCGECHKAIHYNGTAAALSKIVGQLQWEYEAMAEEYPMYLDTLRQGKREAFRKRYGRSYL